VQDIGGDAENHRRGRPWRWEIVVALRGSTAEGSTVLRDKETGCGFL